MAQTPEDVDFHIAKEKFVSGERVCFEFINRGRQTVQLPSPHPWMVVDAMGEIMFSPMAAQVIASVEPASRKQWCWDQRRKDGQFVDPGRYVIKMNVYIENEMKVFRRKIEITK